MLQESAPDLRGNSRLSAVATPDNRSYALTTMLTSGSTRCLMLIYSGDLLFYAAEGHSCTTGSGIGKDSPPWRARRTP
ncbi:hypothetical protein NOCA2680001 [metagenome]|uniref:Uncharacterized protein n=1 Tax=metagenome TaxID=256318 RepID=A0A2P2CCN3_9ZZZZ